MQIVKKNTWRQYLIHFQNHFISYFFHFLNHALIAREIFTFQRVTRAACTLYNVTQLKSYTHVYKINTRHLVLFKQIVKHIAQCACKKQNLTNVFQRSHTSNECCDWIETNCKEAPWHNFLIVYTHRNHTRFYSRLFWKYFV